MSYTLRLLPAAAVTTGVAAGVPAAASGVGAAVRTPVVAGVIVRAPAAVVVVRVVTRTPAARVVRLAVGIVRTPVGSAGLAFVDDLRLGGVNRGRSPVGARGCSFGPVRAVVVVTPAGFVAVLVVVIVVEHLAEDHVVPERVRVVPRSPVLPAVHPATVVVAEPWRLELRVVVVVDRHRSALRPPNTNRVARHGRHRRLLVVVVGVVRQTVLHYRVYLLLHGTALDDRRGAVEVLLCGVKVVLRVRGVTRGERSPSRSDGFQAARLLGIRIGVLLEVVGQECHQPVVDGVCPPLETSRLGRLVLLVVLLPEPGAQRQVHEKDEYGSAEDDQGDLEGRSAARARLGRVGRRPGCRPGRHLDLRDRADPVREDLVGILPAVLHGCSREGTRLVGDRPRQVVAVG